MDETEEFLAQLLPRLEAAERALHNGEASLRDDTWSHNEPVTLFGAWLTAAGWAQCRDVFAKVAARFSDSASGEYELIAAGASGDLAYTVGYEHTVTHMDGVEKTYTLRATQVYRREDGVWKVVHRHGDGMPVIRPDEVVDSDTMTVVR